MLQSEKIDKILLAIAKVKSEMDGVKKNNNNPFFKSKYASLNDHLDMVEPLLEKYGCFILQPTVACLPETISETLIVHSESGQYIGGSMTLISSKPDMQQLGAAATYARRFVLSGLLAIKAEDDDGNTATGKTFTQQSSTQKSTASSTPTPKSGGFSFKKKVVPMKEEKNDEPKEGDMY